MHFKRKVIVFSSSWRFLLNLSTMIWLSACVYLLCIDYRLITAYLLLLVNCDQIMHMRWDFDASSAQNRRVSALDKHQNWSESALCCHISWEPSNYAVINLIHTQHKQVSCVFKCDESILLDAHARVSTALGVQSHAECNYTKIMQCATFVYFEYHEFRLAATSG